MPHSTRNHVRKRRADGGHRLALSMITAACLAAVLVGCTAGSGPTQPPPPDPPLPGNSSLYLLASTSRYALALHSVDTTTGKATQVGDSYTSEWDTSGPGLAANTRTSELAGVHAFRLVQVSQDGRTWHDPSPDGAPFAEGAAFDDERDVLYSASNGFLQTRSSTDGALVEGLLGPPNEQDIEGLAFDPETRTLYGLARGHTEQPQFDDIWEQLYALDVDAADLAWAGVGRTGHLWAGAGLAFDPEARVLYAVGSQDDPGALFRIDPETAATVKVGDTGLTTAAGGLAWMSDDEVGD